MDRETAEPQVESFPGDRAREWAEYHSDVAATTTYVYEFVWDVTADAEGPFCTDVDGNVLMDFTSHVAAAPLGYNNPKLMDRLEAFDLVDPLKIAGQDFYVGSPGGPEDPEIPSPTQLMDRITDLTDHYDLDTVFLSNSGAEAVENAIKACYDDTGGHRAVGFRGAFHGRTLGALSLNRSKHAQRKGFPEIAGVTTVPYSEEGITELRSMLHPEKGHLPAEDVAYVIVEPMQGEGGYRFPDKSMLAELGEICTEYDINLIADEIQSGLGRTGEWWGADHYPIEPDVITSAKGLRVGATIANEETFPDERGRLSSTWGAGDVIASLQGVATIDAIHEYDLVSHAGEVGRTFREKLEDANLANAVDVRGRGLMLAVEFDTKDRREAIVENCLKRGLLTLGCGYKTLRLLPPLDVTEREVELAVDLLAEAADEAA